VVTVLGGNGLQEWGKINQRWWWWWLQEVVVMVAKGLGESEKEKCK